MKQKTILTILVLSMFLISCESKEIKLETQDTIEEEPTFNYPKLNPSDLSPQELIKAKTMTPEAQYKEFGGVLVEKLGQEEVQELGYSSAIIEEDSKPTQITKEVEKKEDPTPSQTIDKRLAGNWIATSMMGSQVVTFQYDGTVSFNNAIDGVRVYSYNLMDDKIELTNLDSDDVITKKFKILGDYTALNINDIIYSRYEE
jgi:hypothetical protein